CLPTSLFALVKFSVTATRVRGRPMGSWNGVGDRGRASAPGSGAGRRGPRDAGRAMAPIAAIGGVDLVDDDEGAQLHLLHQQLGDAVALGDDDRFPRVEVNEIDLDFTAVSGVDG